jgi:hypothetical protein
VRDRTLCRAQNEGNAAYAELRRALSALVDNQIASLPALAQLAAMALYPTGVIVQVSSVSRVHAQHDCYGVPAAMRVCARRSTAAASVCARSRGACSRLCDVLIDLVRVLCVV